MNKNADCGLISIPEENEAEGGDMKVCFICSVKCEVVGGDNVAEPRGETDHCSGRPLSIPQAEESLPPHHLNCRPTISPSSSPGAGGGSAAAQTPGGGGAFLRPLLLPLPFPLWLLCPRHRDGRVWSPQCLQLPGEIIILTHSVSPHSSHLTLRTVPYLSG